MKQKLKRLRHGINQTTMFGRTFGQQLEELKAISEIQRLSEQRDFILHLPECEHNCILKLCMSLERYRGRSVPWYLTLDYDYPEYEGCPKADDYEIGYYGHELTEGTKQFIHDRCEWALKVIEDKIIAFKDVISQSKKARWETGVNV